MAEKQQNQEPSAAATPGAKNPVTRAETKAGVAPGQGKGAGVTRRDFLRLGLFGTAILFLAQIGGTFATFFWPRKVGAFGGKINLGHFSRYPLDSVTKVEAGKFYLVHHKDGLLAVHWTCTHLGCIVPWKPEAHPEVGGCFCCNCHASEFAPTGEYLGGPAPRPLDLFPVEIADNGDVIVDTGTLVQRQKYLPEQATPIPS